MRCWVVPNEILIASSIPRLMEFDSSTGTRQVSHRYSLKEHVDAHDGYSEEHSSESADVCQQLNQRVGPLFFENLHLLGISNEVFLRMYGCKDVRMFF